MHLFGRNEQTAELNPEDPIATTTMYLPTVLTVTIPLRRLGLAQAMVEEGNAKILPISSPTEPGQIQVNIRHTPI